MKVDLPDKIEYDGMTGYDSGEVSKAMDEAGLLGKWREWVMGQTTLVYGNSPLKLMVYERDVDKFLREK